MSSQETDPWDEVALDWDRDAGPRQYAAAGYASLIAELGERNLDLAGMRVLDFGAGTGLLSELIAPSAASLLAVDTSAAMRAQLATKASAWPAVTVADRLPDGEGDRFDLVVASSVLGFVDDYAAAANRLVGFLRPGGLFVQWDWERVDPDDHGLTRQTIVDVLGAAGLDAVTVKTGFTVEVENMQMAPLMGAGVRRAQR